MTSSQIRQSFLDFFKSKQHTIVPSSSLMPDSPNLLFTNAGMNQFVPIFLGQTQCPYTPGRAADTQKCIRAGGKHNDLEDVGLDTYHHTFFEMLGNWSFGDYFKKEAIEWAWELVTEVWKFPKERLYATVYQPDPSKGDPSEFDQEAYDHWARLFTAAGLDPQQHIVSGNKKDNFWMMGETGPCGPCSELHVDLTPNGDTKGALVNKGSPQCIEIWNLVFMQFNANPDGTFSPLPAKSVDTGMGFERVSSIMQCTRNFTDFTGIISNYETDIFRPIFEKLGQMSGKRYGSTLPKAGSTGDTEPEKVDVAFRVIADHIRTLSFSIADGIQPGNTDRNYVLRRILRRAVRYGRTLGFHEPFFYKLVDVLAENMGDVFPEIRARKNHVQEVIRIEEEAFNRTLDSGTQIFEKLVSLDCEWHEHLERVAAALTKLRICNRTAGELISSPEAVREFVGFLHSSYEPINLGFEEDNLWPRVASSAAQEFGSHLSLLWGAEEELWSGDDAAANYDQAVDEVIEIGRRLEAARAEKGRLSGETAFLLYDTYGFPLDLTELMARERGLTVETAGFEKLMEDQRNRARAAQKKQIVEVSSIPALNTSFVGYSDLSIVTKTAGIVGVRDKGVVRKALVTEATPFYAEMGGQVGDIGEIRSGDQTWHVTHTIRVGDAVCHLLSDEDQIHDDLNIVGFEVALKVDAARRAAIQRHHTVTHLLHWAIHEVVSKDASQKGSFVGPDKFTFDFNGAPLTPQQVADVERLVNERILENAPVVWNEVPFAEIKGRAEVMQFFGEKYGDTVRVVQIGGKPGAFDGYSMELCGGTHCRATGEIGLFRIVAENAIAAGVRRIEAVAGMEAYEKAHAETTLIKNLSGIVSTPVLELEKKLESLLEQQRQLEKTVKAFQQRQAAENAKAMVSKARTLNGVPALIERVDADGDTLQAMVNELKGLFKGVVVLAGAANSAVSMIASVSPEFTKQVQAGKIIQQIAPIVGGKGGGKPDNARGGGKDVTKIDEALGKAATLIA